MLPEVGSTWVYKFSKNLVRQRHKYRFSPTISNVKVRFCHSDSIPCCLVHSGMFSLALSPTIFRCHLQLSWQRFLQPAVEQWRKWPGGLQFQFLGDHVVRLSWLWLIIRGISSKWQFQKAANLVSTNKAWLRNIWFRKVRYHELL